MVVRHWNKLPGEVVKLPGGVQMLAVSGAKLMV